MKDDIEDKETEQEMDQPLDELRQAKKGHKQIIRSEELYRTIFETAGTAIIIIERDTTIRIANSNFEKLSGYSKQELEGKMSWTMFIADEDVERMKSYHNQRRSDMSSAPAEYEFSFVNRYGEIKDILLNMAMIEGTSRSVASCMDITDRKHAEESLRRSEENYRNILESIQEVYYEVDLKGKFTFFNPRAWGALGYSKEELTNMNFRDYMDADNIQKVFEAFHHVFLTGEPIPSIEFDAIMKNHERLPAEASVSLRRDSTGRVIGFKGVVRDITWRKEEQKARHQSEERYRLLAENSSDVIWTLSLDGRFTYVSPSIKAFSGYDPEEIVGKSPDALLTPESLSFVMKLLATELGRPSEKRGRSGTFELKHYTRDGSIKDIEVSITWILNETGEPVGLQGSTRDITERKQTEEALRQGEEKYRNILESIEEGYYEVDLKGRFTLFNDSLCRIFGSTREELPGLNYGSFVSEEYAQEIYKTYNTVFKTGTDLESVNWEFTRKSDATKIFIELSVSRILSKDGQCTGFRGMVRDVTNRIKAEKALMESEQRYRLLAENINDIIWTADLNYNFTYVSPWVKQVARATVEDTLKFNVRNVMKKDVFTRIHNDYQEILDRINRGEGSVDTVRRYEFEHTRGDGTTFWADTKASLQFDKDGKPVGFVGITRDITERIKAEEEIKKKEAKYRSILESIQEGYYEVDLTGHFTFFNDSFCSMVGYTPEEVMGAKYRAFVDEETAHKIFDVFHRVYLTGNPDKGFDWSIVRKDGTKNAIESSTTLMRGFKGEPIGFRGVMRDVTERKQAQEALRVSEERFRDLAELLPETVYEAQMDGRLTFVNKSGLEHFGYSEEDLKRGLTIRDVIASKEIHKMEDNIARLFKGEPTGLREYTVVRRDKTTFPALAHSAPIMRDGDPQGIRGFLVDISEKKSLEERLLHAQRMESIGTLAGGVAHDFNNLLMGILGNVSLIGMDLNVDENSAVHERLKNMESYIKRASDLTRQLLGFARGGKYEVKVTDLKDFIRRSTDMFTCTHKEIRVHTLADSHIWPVEVDQTQIEQVMLNLYMNAWQAMPGGGDLYVGLENTALTDITAQAYELVPGRYVKITVRDTGIGMDKATKERIFDPFFTTKEMGRGTGLGLASVYGIVKNHDGFVGVESEPGVGTEFFIYLPASTKLPDREEPVQEVEKGDNSSVLLVDDEEMILDVGSALLENLGYRVLKARGGRSGLEEFSSHHADIDLVILDMIMPDLSGKEVFTRMKKIDPKVRVLLASGYSINSQAEEILEGGCKGFIQKPFSLQILSKKIREVLGSAAK